MALKYRKATHLSIRACLSLLLFAIASLWLEPNSALAVGNAIGLPSLAAFSELVQDGQKDVIRGVYVENVLALPVVQQPAENANYVSNRDGEVTQFGAASLYGTVGLLAHNHKAGQSFYQLMPGQEVQLIYGNGEVETFVIKKVLQFQALQPTNPYSSFRNLSKDETLTAGQMFNRVYTGRYHLTFQTCIAAEGKLSWGRLFIIALPKPGVETHHQRH